MIRNNKLTSQKGFTLVELLIVIVVIAILAAITIVAYNGVQNKAHTTAANSAASTVIKKAALYQTENQAYPASLSTLQTATTTFTANDPAYLPTADATAAASGKFNTGSGMLTAKPTGNDADKTVNYQVCGTDAGAIVSYWDFSDGSAKSLTTGDTTGCVAV